MNYKVRIKGPVLRVDSTTRWKEQAERTRDGGLSWIIPQLDEITDLVAVFRSSVSIGRADWLSHPWFFRRFYYTGLKNEKKEGCTRNARGQLNRKSFQLVHAPLIPNSSVLLRYSRTWSSFFPVPSIRRLDFLLTCWHETFYSLRLKGLSVTRERRSSRSSMQLQTASHRDAIVRRSFARDAFEFFVEIRFFFFSFFSRNSKTFVGGYVVQENKLRYRGKKCIPSDLLINQIN